MSNDLPSDALSLVQHAERMLVVCNKTDALPDELAGISVRPCPSQPF